MEFLFFAFSSISIIYSIIVISARNPIHSILSLIFVFLNVVFIFFILEVEFLSFIFLLVYIGAVSILFLFIVMMLNIKIVELSKDLIHYFPIVIIFGFFLFFFVLFKWIKDLESVNLLVMKLFVKKDHINWLALVDDSYDISNFNIIFTFYFYFLLVCGIILLVALIGAVVLTIENLKEEIKKQEIDQQTSRDPKNSIFLIKEKKKKKKKNKIENESESESKD